MRPLTLQHLRDEPLDRLIRELDERLAAVMAPHRIGDPYPQVSVRDWALVAGVALRIFEIIRERESGGSES